MLRDGFVHFSDLKRMALSPAHYRASVAAGIEVTRAMRVGTIVDRMALGGAELAVYEGQRRGKAWEEFQAAQAPGVEIVTRAEVDDAEPIAAALLADPVARQYLDGRHQVQLEWEQRGFRCRTRGIDILGDGWLADLKVTSSTHPDRWRQHATSMLYHAQLAFYAEAARQHGHDVSKGAFLVGVEASPPYAVTVLRLTPRMLEEGNKCIGLWLERLAVSIASDEWPAYTQSVLDLDAAEEEAPLTFGGKAFDWDGEESAA